MTPDQNHFRQQQRTIRPFILVMSLVLGLIWYFVGLHLLLPLATTSLSKVLVTSFCISTWGLQVWRWSQLRSAENHPRLLFATYFFLGLFSQFFIAAIAQVIASCFFELTPLIRWSIIALGVLLNILSLYFAQRGPVIKPISLKSGLTGKPVKIVQISDLHVGPIIQKDYVEKVVQKIIACQPDAVVATGDIGDGEVSLLSEALSPLSQLGKYYPCYYVTGNHEYYWHAPSWIDGMSSVGFKPLINQGEELFLPGKIPLWIGGVPDQQGASFIPSHHPQPDQAISMLRNKDEAYKILLSHRPQTAPAAHQAGFDLMLCGHTHGGQFFPFTLLVGFFNLFSRGLNRYQNLWVYVNLGTGFWGPPLRLGAMAEISEIVIS